MRLRRGLCLAGLGNDQMERLWKMVMRSYVLCHFNHIKEMNLDFLLLSLSILRTMILLLKSFSKMLLELCVWSFLVGNDQASNYWKEWCDPYNTPRSPSSAYWWVSGPTRGEYLIGRTVWLIPSPPLLAVWSKAIQRVNSSSFSITGSYNKELKEKTLQENKSLSDSEKIRLRV